MKMAKRAFTLVEMLIVIVIIGILAAALIPRLTGIQARARDTSRQADINQVNQAIQMYAVDNNGNYPNSGSNYTSLATDLSSYLSDFPNEARSGQGMDATTCTTAGDDYWYSASNSGYVVTANLESAAGGNDGDCSDIAAPNGGDGYFTIFGN